MKLEFIEIDAKILYLMIGANVERTWNPRKIRTIIIVSNILRRKDIQSIRLDWYFQSNYWLIYSINVYFISLYACFRCRILCGCVDWNSKVIFFSSTSFPSHPTQMPGLKRNRPSALRQSRKRFRCATKENFLWQTQMWWGCPIGSAQGCGARRDYR